MASYLDTDGLSHLWLKLKSIFYQKPDGGIPKTHLATSVQTSLDKANSAYQKPDGGIPKTDLASTVQTSLGKADTALQNHQDISGKLNKSGDTMSGALNMGNKKITSLAAPTNNTDAATKKYVDDKSHSHSNKSVLDGIDSSRVQAWNSTLSLDGGVMQGDLDMAEHGIFFSYGPTVISSVSPGACDETDPSLVLEGIKINPQTGVSTVTDVILKGVATPIDNTDAVNKQYVDDGFISSSGGKASGTLEATGFWLCNSNGSSLVALEPDGMKLKVIVTAGDGPLTCIECASPTEDNDAANKAYVDSKVSQSGHTHSNKTVLDGITSSKVSAWDAKATTSYVDSAISTAVASAVVYKGSKTAIENLPTTGNKTGDMWNVSADGMNYVWDGSNWDAQAPTFRVESITNAEIDSIVDGT